MFRKFQKVLWCNIVTQARDVLLFKKISLYHDNQYDFCLIKYEWCDCFWKMCIKITPGNVKAIEMFLTVNIFSSFVFYLHLAYVLCFIISHHCLVTCRFSACQSNYTNIITLCRASIVWLNFGLKCRVSLD